MTGWSVSMIVAVAPFQRHFNNSLQILHTDIVYNLSITLYAYALI